MLRAACTALNEQETTSNVTVQLAASKQQGARRKQAATSIISQVASNPARLSEAPQAARAIAVQASSATAAQAMEDPASEGGSLRRQPRGQGPYGICAGPRRRRWNGPRGQRAWARHDAGQQLCFTHIWTVLTVNAGRRVWRCYDCHVSIDSACRLDWRAMTTAEPMIAANVALILAPN
jgi:hypothetical protein